MDELGSAIEVHDVTMVQQQMLQLSSGLPLTPADARACTGDEGRHGVLLITQAAPVDPSPTETADST